MDSAKVYTPGDYRPTKNRSKGPISMNERRPLILKLNVSMMTMIFDR